jgi:transcriptional regulator with XRE-family HTH domain
MRSAAKQSANLIDRHVGSRVRMRRLMLGLSQTALAQALGITFQQVQKYEKGTNRISASRLQQISNFLQAPVPFFFDGLPGPTQAAKRAGPKIPPNVSDFLATSDGVSLVKAYTQIKSRNFRRAILDLVEELARPSA